jgi:hypothetical protein
MTPKETIEMAEGKTPQTAADIEENGFGWGYQVSASLITCLPREPETMRDTS